MPAILTLLGIAAATALAAPAALTRGRWRFRHPRAALAAWHLALLVGLLALAASGAIAISLAIREADPAAANPVEALIVLLFAWGVLAVLGAGCALIATAAEPWGARSADERAGVRRLIASSGYRRERRGRVEVRFVRSERLFACALRDPKPTVLVTSALETALTPAQLEAVIAHERCHLGHRHDLAVLIARVHAACLPRFASARALRQATATLIELIADDAAARRCGAANLANALSVMAADRGDAGAELRAERLSRRAWRRPAQAPARVAALAVRPRP